MGEGDFCGDKTLSSMLSAIVVTVSDDGMESCGRSLISLLTLSLGDVTTSSPDKASDTELTANDLLAWTSSDAQLTSLSATESSSIATGSIWCTLFTTAVVSIISPALSVL